MPTPETPDPTYPNLTAPQIAALEALTSGSSATAAARAANVCRKTLYNWLRPGHPFAEALNEWKTTTTEFICARCILLTQAATVQANKAINGGDTRAALVVIKESGCLSPQPSGPTLAHFRAQIAQSRAAMLEAEKQDQLSLPSSPLIFRHSTSNPPPQEKTPENE